MVDADADDADDAGAEAAAAAADIAEEDDDKEDEDEDDVVISNHVDSLPDPNFFACAVCMVNQKCMIFSGCKHLATCYECTKRIGGVCPICRKFSKPEIAYC